MMKVAGVFLLLCAVLASADARVQAHRGLVASNGVVSANHPYLFLSVPRAHSGAIVQGFQVAEEDDEDGDSDVVARFVDNDGSVDDDHDDEEHEHDYIQSRPRKVVAVLDDNDEDDAADDDDDDQMLDEDQVSVQPMSAKKQTNMQLVMKNAKPTHMMVSREHAGAIMVPDGIIEIEGQSVVDEKTGKAALLVPRAALEAIPDGSVVALMERSTFDETEEERANRVVVRRRRKGSRRNVKRRGSNNRRRRRRGGNKVRRGNNRVRVVYSGGNNQRRGVRRGSRPMVNQG